MSRVSGYQTSRSPSSDFAPTVPSPSRFSGLPAWMDGEIAAWRQQIDRATANYLSVAQADYLRHPVFAGLNTDLAEFVCRPGKRLRPLLFVLAHRIFRRGSGADVPPVAEEALRSVAVSLELLHAFILIHDDIIDRAETRRGIPALHRVIEGRFASFTDRRRAGRNLALVAGDILFALAQKCLLESSLPPEVKSRLGSLLLCCMVETGFGEAADIIHGARDVSKVGVDEIEHMYCLKTTCYTIQGPLEMAAILAGGDEKKLEAIGRIAKPAGLAFQIQNDLQEFARFEVSDAAVPADILEGKKTLLLRTAFDRLNETDRGLLQLCFSAGTPTEGTVSKARELVVKSGAVGELTLRMDRLFAASQEQIRWPGFSPVVQLELAALLQFIRGAAVRS